MKSKIINSPALYGQSDSLVQRLPDRRRGPNPWLLLLPGIVFAVAAAWVDVSVGRAIGLAVLAPSVLLLSIIYRRTVSLYAVHALNLSAYAAAAHYLGFCC